MLYVPPLENLAGELDKQVKRFNEIEWDRSHQNEIPWDEVPDFLTTQKKEFDKLEQNFTSEIKKFVEKN
jgi:hypothetical protein